MQPGDYVNGGYLGGFSRPGGATSAQNIYSVSGCYPLYTCQTGTGYFYNELSLYHMNERDLNSMIDYRRKTGEDQGNPMAQETSSFATQCAQIPYLFLDHSQIVNYRNTNQSENRSVSPNSCRLTPSFRSSQQSMNLTGR
jgi:hypothetical protein